MKFKSGSKHKYDTTQFIPGQVLRGKVNLSKILKLSSSGDIKKTIAALSVANSKRDKT